MNNPLDDAACAFFVKDGIVHPDIWFSTDESDDSNEAKFICSVCPVSADCEAFAIDTNQKYGIWGGRQFADSNTEESD